MVCVFHKDAGALSSWNGQNECDLMVPGEQLGDTAPVAAGDDLRGPG